MMSFLFRPQSPRSASAKSGFSLIEVMVGFAVFALTMISVMGVLAMSQFIGESARNRIEALQDARDVMEYLKSETYHSSSMLNGDYTVTMQFNSPNWQYVVTNSSSTVVATIPRQTEGYSGSYTVSSVTSGGISAGELKQIVLRIDYNSFLGTDQLVLVTEKSRALN